MSAEDRLVGVDSDTPHARVLGGAQRPQSAQARHVEHGACPARDLAPRDGLALVRVEEIVRISREDGDARVGGSSAGAKADDEVVHRRDVDSPDGADDVLARPELLQPRGKPAGEIRGLERLDHHRLHVPRRPAEDAQRGVEERETRLREARRHRRERVHVIEGDDDEVVVLPGEQRQRPDRVLAQVRRDDAATHPALAQRPLEAGTREAARGAAGRDEDDPRAARRSLSRASGATRRRASVPRPAGVRTASSREADAIVRSAKRSACT